MGGWLETLLGIDLSGWTPESSWRIEWTNFPRSGDLKLLFGLLVAAALFGVVALYRRDAQDLSRTKRIGLTLLRAGIVLALVVILCEPVLVISKTEEVPSNLVVLRDVSASMDVRDTYDADSARRIQQKLGLEKPSDVMGLSRSDLVDLVAKRGLTAALARNGDRLVQVHPFADRFFLDPEVDDAAVAGAKQFTAIGSSLEQALASYRGPPLAGVLLVSDGQSNVGATPERAAELAATANVPVHVLATGRDAAPKNATLLGLDAEPVVFVRDPIQLTAVIGARGLDGETGSVRIERRVDGGAWETLKTDDVDFLERGRVAEITLTHVSDRPAELDFRATIEPLDGEIDTTDNVAVTKVRVVRQQLRTLLVAGLAFPEVQFLINALLRDPSIEVSTWLQSADTEYPQKGNEVIRRLPLSAEELDEYDCVVLYDPDLRKLPPNFPPLLRDFVGQSGGGLVFIAGESHTSDLFDKKAIGAEALLTLLPVVRDPGAFRSRVQQRLILGTEWRLRLTADGLEDPVFRFDDDPEKNAKLIRNLPGMYWHFAVDRAKPGATVLARHGDPRMTNQYGAHVVFATQLYGPGRTFFLGLDSTYRWRYLDEQLFDGFWARVIDKAGRSKVLGGRQPLIVATDEAEIAPGGFVTISATFRNPRERPADLRMLVAEVEDPDETLAPVTLTPSPADPERFEGRFRVTRTGEHTIRAWPTETPQENAKASTARFRVAMPDAELESPSLNRGTLERVAATTGGRVFDVDEYDRIPDAFATGRVAITDQFRQELWDAPLLAGLALLLLFTEWILRKRFRLV